MQRGMFLLGKKRLRQTRERLPGASHEEICRACLEAEIADLEAAKGRINEGARKGMLTKERELFRLLRPDE